MESTGDSNGAGMAEAFQSTATGSGTVSSLTLYVDSANAAKTIIVGLYTNSGGRPATLLSQARMTSFSKGAWNTVSIPATAVAANTVYWIAVLGTGGTVAYRDGGTTCVSWTSSQSTLTTLPASWSAGKSWNSCRLSAYGSASTSGPILSLSQSAVSFAATQGSGTNPAANSIAVNNIGTGALTFTAASDSTWLTMTPASGTAPQTLQISAILGTLKAGTYTGHVTVTAAGIQGSPAKITATFTVAAPPPILSLSATTLAFSATQGSGKSPAAASVGVTNTGGGTLSYTAASSASWLSVSPVSGTAPKTLQISAALGTLVAGTYSGQVTVTASGVQGSPATIAVTFTVASPPPVLSLSTKTLSFGATQGSGTNSAAATVNVTNTGGGTLSFTAASNASWLSVSPGSGTAPGNLQISAALGTLAAGTYNGQVTVTASGVQGSPATIAVTFTVAPAPPVLSLSTTALSFGAVWGGTNPAAQSVGVSNAGGGTLSFTAASNASWLSVSPGSGTAPGNLQISAALGTLAAGTYNGQVMIAASGAQGSPAPIAVTFTVAPPSPVLSLSATTLSFSATEGGTDPASATVSVNNAGGGTLNFTATSDSPWLNVTPGSGTAPQTLQISAALGTLTPGPYAGNVTVTADGIKGSPATVAVAFTVAPQPPILSLSAPSLSFSGTFGSAADPVPASVNLSNTGGGTLGYTATTDSPWLTVTPGSGTAPQTLQVSAALGTLAVGNYSGNVIVTSVGAQNSPTVIPVTFAVAFAAPSVLIGDQSTESLAYSASDGQALATQAIATATGPVTSLSVYLDGSSTASQVFVGLYSDNGGHPGTLLAQGNSSTLTADAWNMIAIPTANVTSGLPYWIALLGAEGTGIPAYRTATLPGPCASETSMETALMTLPASWTTGAPGSICPVSIYGVSDPSALTFTISGTVSGTSGAIPVALSGSLNTTINSDGSGNYSFTGLPNGGSYTITPEGLGFTYTPPSQTLTLSGMDIPAVNFSAAIQVAPTFSISGTISPASTGGANATVALSGSSVASTFADASGNYSFTGLAAGNYVVAPSNAGFVFGPSTQSVSLTAQNATGVNFAASVAPPTYSISGTITLSSNGSGAGALVTLSGNTNTTTTADSSGKFSFSGLVNGTYTVTPSSSAAIFAPVSQSVKINGAAKTAVNFTATALLLYDDFTAPSLSSAWYAMNTPGDSSNSELECYVPSQDVLSGGYLVITAVVQKVTCGQPASSASYASGQVTSSSFNFTYGTVEFRAKLSGGQGSWPAIWLLGYQCQPADVYWSAALGNCNWPAPGSDEIDIAEVLNSVHTSVNQEIHTGMGKNGSPLHNDGCTATTSDTSQNYHVYDLIWSKGSMIWKIDGTTTCTIQQSYVPSTAMFFILDVAVGGTGGGTVKNTTFPQSSYIDYIKVTQP